MTFDTRYRLSTRASAPGRCGYEARRRSRAGLLDVTHLRFFTRRDALRMLEAAGLRT
jgi:hypothetical protein